jgi:hypothetical protein
MYFAQMLCKKKQVSTWEGADDMGMQRAHIAVEILNDNNCVARAETNINKFISDSSDL